MKLKFPLFFAFAIFVALITPRAAHADLGYWSAALVGTWKHPQTGEIYRFNSNATYTTTYAKPTTEMVAGSSGWWKIAQPTEKESGGGQEGPVALILKQRKLLFNNEGRKYNRNFKMEYRLIVDTVTADDAENKNLYRIAGVNWKRIK